MSLKPKLQPNNNHKKIQATHHRHSKTYLKTYWPYIPIVAIAILGITISNLVHHGTHSQVRLAAYTYYNILESSIGILALAIFLLRHAFAWHKVFVKGENFVINHPLLDIILFATATLGFVLSSHGLVII